MRPHADPLLHELALLSSCVQRFVALACAKAELEAFPEVGRGRARAVLRTPQGAVFVEASP